MTTKDWVKFIFIGLVWGSTFMWVKLGIREVGPFTLVMYRSLFASLALWTLIKFKKNEAVPLAICRNIFCDGAIKCCAAFCICCLE